MRKILLLFEFEPPFNNLFIFYNILFNYNICMYVKHYTYQLRKPMMNCLQFKIDVVTNIRRFRKYRQRLPCFLLNHKEDDAPEDSISRNFVPVLLPSPNEECAIAKTLDRVQANNTPILCRWKSYQ